MSIFLHAVGAICVLAGAAMAAYGIPVSEFSFGNTLILAGAISVVGGLIVIGLGAAVSRLPQIVEAGHGPAPVHAHRPMETFEGAPVRAGGGRIPFPPKPKAETRPEPKPEIKPEIKPETRPEIMKPEPARETMREPLPAVIAPEAALPRKEAPAQTLAPTLPNPDEAPMTVAEDVSLSPPQPEVIAEAPAFAEPQRDRATDTRDKPAAEIDWGPAESMPAAEKRGAFAFMWPERKAEKAPAAKEELPAADVAPAEPAREQKPEVEIAAQPELETVAEAPKPAGEPRNVAILKSGVVDGMGYTLYVDGSIEAELPQGTLRFASINELREHLEQNT